MPAITQYASIDDLDTLGVTMEALADIEAPPKATALVDASDVMNGYLRGRYTLPLLAVSGDFKRYCLAIAVYDLLSARGYNPEAGADGNIRDRYLDAIKWLEGVRDGKINPDVADSSPDAVPGGPGRARVISSSSRGWSNRGTGRPRGAFESD
jgi:phage gp36-like protein